MKVHWLKCLKYERNNFESRIYFALNPDGYYLKKMHSLHVSNIFTTSARLSYRNEENLFDQDSLKIESRANFAELHEFETQSFRTVKSMPILREILQGAKTELIMELIK